MSTNRLSAAMYSSAHLENCAKIARPDGDLPLAAMGCNSRTPDLAGSRQICNPLLTQKEAGLCFCLANFRNRRDIAARAIVSICHYRGLLPRTLWL